MIAAEPDGTARPTVTVVVPVWNSGRWLPDCLEALGRQTFERFRTLVVDNGSTDGSTEGLDRTAGLDLHRLPKNYGFAAAVNVGIAQSDGDYIALLNVDTRPRPEWLAHLVRRLDASPPTVGAVASRMLSLEDPTLIDDAGDTLSWYGSATKQGHGEAATAWNAPREVFSTCAGAALYRRAFFDEVGTFDETFGSYFEDVDLGFRGRIHGYRYLYEPGAEVLHQGHGSGLPRSRYVVLVTCNRLLTLWKNVPAPLARRHWRSLLYGQLYFFAVYRRPLASLAGYLRALPRLPAAMRRRRRLAAARKVSIEALDGMLTTELGEPSLGQRLGRKLGFQRRGGRSPAAR